MASALDDPRTFLRQLFDAAVERAQPTHCLPPFMPAPPKGRCIVVGAGKGVAAMARAFEQHYRGDVSGVVVTKKGEALPTQSIRVLEARHPIPDEASMAAAKQVLAAVQGLSEDDLVVCLLMGGGSALLALPRDGVNLLDKQRITDALLKAGADIDEINCVRRHLSAIKGGKLALAAAPARVLTLAISDVAGDDPLVVASGPTVPDGTSGAHAAAILASYDIMVPAGIRRLLATEPPQQVTFPPLDYQFICRPRDALAAAADSARTAGINVRILGDDLVGDAAAVAQRHAQMALEVQGEAPLLILSGGELTVKVKGDGQGGPNSTYCLALAQALQGQAGIWALAADTDGLDGAGPGAGALVTPDTLARAAALGLSPKAALVNNDAGAFFDALGDVVATGPTYTNVNDFRALLVLPV